MWHDKEGEVAAHNAMDGGVDVQQDAAETTSCTRCDAVALMAPSGCREGCRRLLQPDGTYYGGSLHPP
jgi:hypothetical protein